MVWHSVVRKLKLLLNLACHSVLHFITWPLNITPTFLIFKVFETLPSLIHLHDLTLHAQICLTNY